MWFINNAYLCRFYGNLLLDIINDATKYSFYSFFLRILRYTNMIKKFRLAFLTDMVYWYHVLQIMTFKILPVCSFSLLTVRIQLLKTCLWTRSTRWKSVNVAASSILEAFLKGRPLKSSSHDTFHYHCTSFTMFLKVIFQKAARWTWCSHVVFQTPFIASMDANKYCSLTRIVWEKPTMWILLPHIFIIVSRYMDHSTEKSYI